MNRHDDAGDALWQIESRTQVFEQGLVRDAAQILEQVAVVTEIGAQIAGFIERREAIQVTYQTFGGRVSEYTLRPYHLLAYHGNWYVFAWNTAKDRVATFALSRFRHIEPTGARFAPPTDFDPKAYAKNAFGITGRKCIVLHV